MAINHVLSRTGYRLCSPPPGFVSLPLPASHLNLGPMTLAAALQTLAGPAWTLTVEQEERLICFERIERNPK
jgi:type IV pili sensor histidine kinase/response regulator